MNHQTFFTTEIEGLIAPLKADTPRLWGKMTAAEMLDHVHAGSQLFSAKRHMALNIPEEKLERYRALLLGERDFREGGQKPEQYREFEKLSGDDIETQKQNLVSEIKRFEEQTRTDPDFWCEHPIFGRLNAEETRQLQYKHLRLHFQQFGLIPLV